MLHMPGACRTMPVALAIVLFQSVRNEADQFGRRRDALTDDEGSRVGKGVP